MKRIVIILLFALRAALASAQCDLNGILLELQATTSLNGLLIGSSGCLTTATVASPLYFSGDSIKITSGNLTAGSSKVAIGGAGTGALLGTGASVDVVPANILLSTLGGALNLNQLSTTGASTNQVVKFNGTVWAVGADDTGAGTVYYQTLRENGTGQTQQTVANFTDSGRVFWDLTNDAGNTETEVFADLVLNSITNTYIRQGVARSVIGVTGNATANVADIQGTTDQVLRVSTGGTSLGFGQVATGGIANNAVGNAQFRQGVAKSVVGVTANATANVADIAAASADQVLVNNGANTAIAWGTVATGGITNSAVTYAKIQNAVANNVVLGNNNGAGTAYEELNAAALQTLLGFVGTASRFTLWTATNTLGDDAALTFSAANDRMTVTGSLAGTGANNAWLNLNGGAISGATEFLRASANITGAFTGIIANANNTASGTAYWEASVGGTSAGDPFYKTTVTGGTSIVWGQDNSATGDPWRITPLGTAPGSVANVGITVLNQATPFVGINKDLPTYALDVTGRTKSSTGFIGTFAQWSAADIVFGAGAGTGPVLNSISGTDNALYVSFTTGTTPTNNAIIFTGNFPNAWPSSSFVTFSADNTNNSATDITKFRTGGRTAAKFDFVANGTLSASTNYQICFSIWGQ